MPQTKIDWEHHLTQFRASSQSVKAYCAATGLKASSFHYYLAKGKAKRRETRRFKEFNVATELVITRDAHGTLSLSGFEVTHIPQIVSAWSNALSH